MDPAAAAAHSPGRRGGPAANLPPRGEDGCGVAVLWQLLQERVAADGEQGCISDDTMQMLNAVFQRTLMPALEIIDRGWVQRVADVSGRELHVVRGKSQDQYVVLGEWCPCQFFQHSVIHGEAYLCKHLLAVSLRRLLQPPLAVRRVSPAELAALILPTAVPPVAQPAQQPPQPQPAQQPIRQEQPQLPPQQYQLLRRY
eukprot:TRINITY_DN9859_c0_g1_i2.p1 TRINITY_DN9859_c0_g1~~TRINITY_DN9859_c0_g1_i2.p1  ORF type:complete len:234 (+),score=90.08 TRINITY_DN9859_c0_g1_i2:107-703(+)